MTRDEGIHPSSLTKNSFIKNKKILNLPRHLIYIFLFITDFDYVQCDVTFVYINFLEQLGDGTYANICCRLSRIIFNDLFNIFSPKINKIYTLEII